MTSSTSTPIRPVNGRLGPERKHPVPEFTAGDTAVTALFRHWPTGGKLGVEAGYTYFGQFLAHELVSGKDRAGAPVERSPALNLESIYDYSSDPCKHGREDLITPEGRFLLDWTTGPHGEDRHLRQDLPRCPNRIARIPEPRNDENLLIAQLHCLFLRFHNATIDRLRGLPAYRNLSGQQQFALARLYVTHTLHFLTINDFLHRLCNPTVFTRIFAQGRRYVEILPGEHLPLEFTHAAFRFGHSMILPSYSINKRDGTTTTLTLPELFLQTGPGGMQRLADALVVDWHFFFANLRGGSDYDPIDIAKAALHEGSGVDLNSARQIDPGIEPTMLALPHEPGNPDIALRNLNQGVRMGLVSGQELAQDLLQRMGMDPDNNELGLSGELVLIPGSNKAAKERLLQDAGFFSATPLWLYVLVEAGELGLGTRLGPLGSLIVAECLRNSISNHINGLNEDERSRLTRLRAVLPAIKTMQQLINHVQGDNDASQ